MNIVHIHLLGPYTEGWGYQENILPKVQAREGHDVTVITNCYKHMSDGTVIEVDSGEFSDGDVRVIRLKLMSKFKIEIINRILFLYPVYKVLENIKPDVILLHGLGSGLTNYQIRRYVRLQKNNVILLGDTHALAENTPSASKSFIREISAMYKIHCKKILYPYYKKIYGVTPDCVEFAKHFYKAPSEKMELLPLGYDPQVCDIFKKKSIRHEFREKMGIPEDMLVITHGGKIIPRRNTVLAINAFLKMKDKSAIMLIFGDISPEMIESVKMLINNNKNKIRYLGHLSQSEYIKVMMASDIGFFPGAQSALWQEAIGCGLPLVLGEAKGIEYLNQGGNMVSVRRSDLENTINVLDDLILNDKISDMKKVAESSARLFFSYERISRVMTEEKLG